MNDKTVVKMFEMYRELAQLRAVLAHRISTNTISELELLQAKEAIRRLRNRISQREHYQAMRSLGLVKTPYGWE